MQTFFLWNALTIVPDRKQSIAVVGGGGKTSLIFRLCEEMVSTGKKVIVTTYRRVWIYGCCQPGSEQK